MPTTPISQEAREELLERLGKLEDELTQDWKDTTSLDVREELHAQVSVIIRLKDEVSNGPGIDESNA